MKYSLTKKTILIIVCITVAISALALAIYDRGIYNLIVSQYGQRSGEITELVAVNVDSKQVSNLQKAVIDIYNNSDTKVMSDRWGTPEFEAYISQFESVKETEDYKAIRADLQCNNCGEIFELKTKKGHLGKKISDGAYSTMIERITSTANPDLLAMNYNSDYYITDLIIIPKFFFVPQIIEKRNPLAPTARRANRVGCNILYSEIPAQGKISIIRNSHIISVGEVTDHYNRIKNCKQEILNQEAGCRMFLIV